MKLCRKFIQFYSEFGTIFGTGDGHKLLLSGGDFRENRRSECRGLLKGVCEAVP